MRQRDVRNAFGVEIMTKKGRPAILLISLLKGRYIAIAGTGSTPRIGEAFVVVEESIDPVSPFVKMGLEKTTYFTAAGLTFLERGDLANHRIGLAPRGLVAQIFDELEEDVAQILEECGVSASEILEPESVRALI